MTSKTDIQKILGKGLTGKEAGRLVLEDNWLVDHKREGFLSDKDIRAIKAGLKTTKDIEDYNAYVHSYRIIDFTLKEAHILALEYQLRMKAIIQTIYILIYDSSSEYDLISKPVIMTEKQYKETQAKQREESASMLEPLDEILSSRYDKLMKADTDWSPEGQYWLPWARKERPVLFKQAVSDIQELIKSGKLKPIIISGKDRDEVQSLWDRIGELQDKQPSLSELQDKAIKVFEEGWQGEDAIFETMDKDKPLLDLHAEDEALLQSLYKAGKVTKESQSFLVSSLGKLAEGSLAQDDEDNLVNFTFCSVGDLYKTGLPEWAYLDNLAPGRQVAILQGPNPEHADKRGYYQARLQKKYLDDVYPNPEGVTKDGLTKAKAELRVLLAYMSIVEAVSETTGMDFTEDSKAWVRDIEGVIAEYNRLRLRVKVRELTPDWIDEEPKVADLQPLNLNSLRPSAKIIKYLRERIAMSLGEGWYEEVAKALSEDKKEQEAQEAQDA